MGGKAVFELISRHGITPRRVSGHKGGEYASSCPGCGDGGKGINSDRFRIWPEQGDGGSWWCRRCGKGGDLIQFLRDFDGLTYPAACEQLGKKLKEQAAIPRQLKTPTATSQQWHPRQKCSQRVNNTWQNRAETLTAYCAERLQENEVQLAWLADRGISRTTAAKFRLGWNPGEKRKDIWRPRSAWGLPKEKRDNGRQKQLWLPVGLVIPKLDDDSGHVERLRIRRPEGDPRYYVVPGSGPSPLFLNRSAACLVVVESELDALAIHEAVRDLVGVYAVGNSKAKPDQLDHEALQQAGLILVSMDFDDPDSQGHRAGASGAAWWIRQYPNAIRWPVPEGKDPGDYFKLGGGLQAWIMAGLPSSILPPKDLAPEPVESDPSIEIDQQENIKPPLYIEGVTESGHSYLVAETKQGAKTLLGKSAGRAVFHTEEVERMVGITGEGIEAVLLIKEVFEGAEVNDHENAETGPQH